MGRVALRARDVWMYRASDVLTGALVYFMVVFSPWAFGTTQPWAIRVMNGAGYLTGLLLAIKLYVRHRKGFRPPRWETPARGRWWTRALAVLTVGILGYCLVSALNARSTYLRHQLIFDYHNFVSWLPHSFDSTRTWESFWNYLALACAFWGVADWLLGKSAGEERAEHVKLDAAAAGPAPLLPARMRGLLWVVCVNGGLLAIESMIQRWEGSGRLLWLVRPRVNPGAEAQFGPYAYRANAAQYFNLVWPVCLGFWWMLHRSVGFRRTSHHWLLACGVLMAACPIISTSRGGAIVSMGIVLLAGFFLVSTHYLLAARQNEDPRTRRRTLSVLVLFFTAAMVLGFQLGWRSLKPRMLEAIEGITLRETMYEVAWPIAEDYPVYGTGPGTFEPLIQYYRPSVDTYWPAQLHNDWLETLITFGWVGSSLIAMAFLVVIGRWFAPGGIHGGRRFVILVWMALTGCLIHARFDFPFQIYSILFLFLVLCAILFTLSRNPEGRRAPSAMEAG